MGQVTHYDVMKYCGHGSHAKLAEVESELEVIEADCSNLSSMRGMALHSLYLRHMVRMGVLEKTRQAIYSQAELLMMRSLLCQS